MPCNTEYRLIPALDTHDLAEAAGLVKGLGNLDFVYGFKIGFSLALSYGLPQVVKTCRQVTAKPLIYDHQKAGTDIPDTGRLFATTLAKAGLDEAIIFPQAGPQTLRAWVKALKEEGLTVIVGGLMTHPAYLVSEGGFLIDSGVVEMYRLAREASVDRFVIPLTKGDKTAQIVKSAALGSDCIFYSPGYGAQGGGLKQPIEIKRHYVIVGRSLLNAADPVQYATDLHQSIKEMP